MHEVEHVVSVHGIEVISNRFVGVEDDHGGNLKVARLAFDEWLPHVLTAVETGTIFAVEVVESIFTYQARKHLSSIEDSMQLTNCSPHASYPV